jgi:hypothetical protein
MRHMFARAAGVATVVGAVLSVALPAQAGHHKPAPSTTTPSTTTATTTPPASVPAGQSTVVQSAYSFDSGLTGWTPLVAATSWIAGVGHTAAGALAVTASGLNTAAASPKFAVTPGARYSADAWSLAALTGHQVGVALKFFDSSGAAIASATELSQGVPDTVGTWTRTYRVVGFAPANAATAQVYTASRDGLTGLIDYFDDVTVWQTTGYATPLVGPLSTSGAKVLDAQGREVHLHGVQLGGMRSTNWTTNTVSTAEIDAAHRYGANLARLPVGENPMTPSDCSYDANYVSTVDRIVNDVTSRGMLLLLDLHTNAAANCGDWGNQQKLPDTKAVTFWQTYANKYKNNPLVAFDLYNEPHDISDTIWRNGGSVYTSGVTYQAAGMQKLYDTVRATGATNLVFASGNGWASTYPAGAPLTGTTNLVWGVHAYTCPAATPANGGVCQSGPGGVEDPSGILSNFAQIGTTQPVMVTEFGWPDASDGRYQTAVDNYATSHGWVGWNAFFFNNFTGSSFDLMKDVGSLWDPTQAGMSAINAMLAD